MAHSRIQIELYPIHDYSMSDADEDRADETVSLEHAVDMFLLRLA